ncbi:WbqC family protein [Desulfonatronovibrio hydrogenovorans]|uniref:WbqC family protein n=1 Tax=Desulfonatronovibrio hydrogenovorans TaxID=53245 RepID=UPI000691F3F6|nr:WbqC family protein [Desulfonatronovibrio hydrogenovorans]
MSIVAIMQPTYLPWIGYFDLIDQVDQFVFFDDVNVLKRSWGVRNRIKTAQEEVFLTVPIKSNANRVSRFFFNTGIDYSHNWQKKHLRTIAQAYSKAPFFKKVYPDFEKLINTQYPTIADLNIMIIRMVVDKIGIKTRLCCSSEISDIDGRKDDRLVKICRALSADKYLSPQGSAVYIEADQPGGTFPDAGVELFYHNYEHPEYPQQGSSFLSHMCILDLLMNCGYEQALDLIRSGRRPMIPYQEFRERWMQTGR